MAFARERPRSAVTSVNALKTASRCLMRASAASVTSSADILRPVTASAMSAADEVPDESFILASSCEDTGGLGLVGQREFVDHAPHPQRYVEGRADGPPPAVLHPQRKRAGDGVDVILKRISSHFVSTLRAPRKRPPRPVRLFRDASC